MLLSVYQLHCLYCCKGLSGTQPSAQRTIGAHRLMVCGYSRKLKINITYSKVSKILILCGQVGYCIVHNGRMCSALETRYLGIRERCLTMARTLSALSYEAQAPLKMRSRTLSSAHACESVNAYLQVIHTYTHLHMWKS